MSDLNDLQPDLETELNPDFNPNFNPDLDPAAAVAYNNFGIKYLFPWQRLVIANILDAPTEEKPSLKQIVLLPTGSPVSR